jgi:RIO kinase 1
VTERFSGTSNRNRYEELEQLHDPAWAEAERSTASKFAKPKPKKKADNEIVRALSSEVDTLESSFKTTYQPARFEAGWLRDSLTPFYDMNFIEDVLAIVKGGKEANVYRCLGGPAAHAPLVAAKVYRPRQFRNLSNDAMYREGREVLAGDGKVVKKNAHRVMRALGKKSAFGVQVAHTSWLMYEFNTLQHLYQAGADVPKPLAVAENAIVMGYVGDAGRAAPLLQEVGLDPALARRLFDRVLHNIEIMLNAGFIHGDLSAYNILFWEDAITLIDFPQVTNAIGNSNARFILTRDIQRVCDYFTTQGLTIQSRGLADELWQRFERRSHNEILADLSRTLAQYTVEEEE